MRKWIFLFFLTNVFLCEVLIAQTMNGNTRFKKNRKIPRDQGISSLKSRAVEFKKNNFKINFSEYRKQKRIYVKFKNSPTKAVRRKLKNFGIDLTEYLTNDTYVIKVGQNRIDKMKKLFHITGFAEIDPTDKISEQLYKENIPTYAKDGNYVKLIVTFFNDVEFNDAISIVKSVGGIVESQSFSRTNKLKITIHPLNIRNLAEIDSVKYIETIPPPPTINNIDAGELSNVFWDNDGNTLSGLFDQDYSTNPCTTYALTGYGINVAIKDGGKIYSHSDFNGRLTIVDNDSVKLHPTHVAGTIASALSINDNDGDTGGMAERVNLYSFSYNVDGSNPAVEETDYAVDYVNAVTNYSAFIINNSWGHIITQQNKNTLGDYSSSAQDIDDFIYDYYDNDAVLTKSAGNLRNVFYQDCDGYYTLDDLSCAKNAIVVGSVGTSEADNEISDFSSCGPTDDGRLKPDVVVDGFKLISTIYIDNDGEYIDAYSDNDSYSTTNPQCRSFWQGTSMSCPVVTGVCALIHEAYESEYGEYPTADIVKALLCNYADDLDNDGPDFKYGFGLVNAKDSINAIFNLDASESGHIIKGVIPQAGDYMEYQFEIVEGVNDDETIKVTLAWIDPPGNSSATNAIVNDLDLRVNNYLPYYFKEYTDIPSPSSSEPMVDPTESAKIGINRYDTVEQVVIEPDNTTGKIPAGTYKITVSGYKVSLLNQPFALVSSIGFKGFHFNTLKVKGAEGDWVSNHFAVLDKNPDVLLMISELDFDNDGFNPSTFEYLSNDGQTWTDWTSISGVYTDEECTQSCSNPYNGVAYVKVNSVPFDNVSVSENRIKFRLTYKGKYIESPEYIVKNNNVYYVSDSTGSDDNDGKGTILSPWETIGHAISSAVATAQVPAYIRVQEGTYNENITMERYVYLSGGYDTD